ncbi:hypothetical protein AVEN_19072-1 [Araneus ventricosus]|uniref:Uncharacterized protein n=1 Tax=Araneus ventricosus TaxID=182803 RepID=A0A4Y2B9R1_ARAVE|nr:hypothetical protein AVEN_19072-1 [Araneus ventricosus]
MRGKSKEALSLAFSAAEFYQRNFAFAHSSTSMRMISRTLACLLVRYHIVDARYHVYGCITTVDECTLPYRMHVTMSVDSHYHVDGFCHIDGCTYHVDGCVTLSMDAIPCR